LAYEPALYEQQRRNLLSAFAQQNAMNAYQRYLGMTQGQRPITQMQEQAFSFTPTGGLGQVPKLTSSFAQRGLQGQGVKSGAYKTALSSYASNRARNLGYAEQDLASAGRGYDLIGTGNQATLEGGLADIESDKARQIAADARALLALR